MVVEAKRICEVVVNIEGTGTECVEEFESKMMKKIESGKPGIGNTTKEGYIVSD